MKPLILLTSTTLTTLILHYRLRLKKLKEKKYINNNSKNKWLKWFSPMFSRCSACHFENRMWLNGSFASGIF